MSTTLLTGATGYVGGRLLRRLEAGGRRVRCLARRAGALEGRVGPTTEVVEADLLDPSSLPRALEGVSAAFYLVHSMGSGADFARQDREAARAFGEAARQAGVERIVYLGGLGRSGPGLSEHLRSRQETGDLLRAGGVPVIELRASIILGSGSLSFEMIRGLVDRLPVMICPRWVSRPTQPIAVDDVLAYLVAALDLPPDARGRVYEIGGPDRVSYADLMREYARQRGLERILIPVPLLSLRLSSLWLGLVTPLYARVGRKLIESVRNATVVLDDAALRDFPEIRPAGVRDAISRAIRSEPAAEASWAQARSSAALPAGRPASGPTRLFLDRRSVEVEAPAGAVFGAVERMGGANGWYSHGALWRLRGTLDTLAGGVGFRRGRRDPEVLAPGDHVDFWRVERIDPPRSLRLEAEMRLPGRAWLEFEVAPLAERRSELRQTARFEARGVFGRLYWWGILPLHRFVFEGLLRGIAGRAEADARRAV